jgi:hypothetical protein
MASHAPARHTVAKRPRPRGTRHARRTSLHCARSKRHATRPPGPRWAGPRWRYVARTVRRRGHPASGGLRMRPPLGPQPLGQGLSQTEGALSFRHVMHGGVHAPLCLRAPGALRRALVCGRALSTCLCRRASSGIFPQGMSGSKGCRYVCRAQRSSAGGTTACQRSPQAFSGQRRVHRWGYGTLRRHALRLR